MIVRMFVDESDCIHTWYMFREIGNNLDSVNLFSNLEQQWSKPGANENSSPPLLYNPSYCCSYIAEYRILKYYTILRF